MTKEEASIILRKHNEWRRYNGPLGCGPEMQNPTELGEAIDIAVESLLQLSLPSDLDEVAEKYAIQGHENHTNVNYINTYIEGKRIGFKAGAEWMAGQDKEKIEQSFFSGYNECENRMKNEFEKRAMVGEINNAGYPTTIQLHTFDSSLKNGDKVNIIIIKQE